MGIWSLHQTTKNDFAIKAAEIVLNSNGPEEGLGKARFLYALFGDDLPRSFASSMATLRPEEYARKDNPKGKQRLADSTREISSAASTDTYGLACFVSRR